MFATVRCVLRAFLPRITPGMIEPKHTLQCWHD